MEALFVYVSKRLEQIRFGKDPKSTSIAKEIESCALWRAVFAEFLATLLFVFVSCASTVTFGGDTESHQARVTRIALAFGLSIMLLIQMIGHVSGGHINPAVSIAMAASMTISPTRALFYVVAQTGGAVVGGVFLKVVTVPRWNTTVNFGATTVNDGITVGQGLIVEVVLTFVLIMVIYGTTDSNRSDIVSGSLAIGFTVTAAHLAAIPYTGCGINPARSLGSAVASDIYENLWIYWAGPIVGGILATVVYKFVINPYKGVKNMDKAVELLIKHGNFIVVSPDSLHLNAATRSAVVTSHI